MRRKIELYLDDSTNMLYDQNDLYLMTLDNTKQYKSVEEQTKANITIQLVKQGVSPEDIIKLKNNDLL